MKKKTAAKLSAKQTMILNRIAMGETSADIAKDLDRSMRTIECTRAIIIKKLGAENIAHAITIAFRKRILKIRV